MIFLIFLLILAFLWGLVELSKLADREEHNRIMEEKDILSDNRVLNVVINEESGTPAPLKKLKKVRKYEKDKS